MQGTLGNLFDESDAGVLGSLECGMTSRRQRQPLTGDVATQRTYGAGHVRATPIIIIAELLMQILLLNHESFAATPI